MALPSHRRTSSDKRRRSAHFALKKVALFACPKCKKPIKPHQACLECGFYKGRGTLDVSRATSRALKRTMATAPAKSETEPKEEKAPKQSEKQSQDK
ncbi:50S ribosomal protein L32 [Patescibacteria group bacterium]